MCSRNLAASGAHSFVFYFCVAQNARSDAMPKKRILSPASVWDEEVLTEAVLGAGGKPVHVHSVYR